jgi:hypothetical protein
VAVPDGATRPLSRRSAKSRRRQHLSD